MRAALTEGPPRPSTPARAVGTRPASALFWPSRRFARPLALRPRAFTCRPSTPSTRGVARLRRDDVDDVFTPLALAS